MKYYKLLVIVSLAIDLSYCVGGIEREDNSCSIYCILSIITSFGTVGIVSICCTCCVVIVLTFKRLFGINAIASGIIRSQRNDAEVGTQHNHIAANPAVDPQATEPTLNYDDVISMDSLPPHIPGYTYNANTVNTRCTVLSTGGEQTTYPNTREVPTNNHGSITTQDAALSIELYADLPSPPPYTDTRDIGTSI